MKGQDRDPNRGGGVGDRRALSTARSGQRGSLGKSKPGDARHHSQEDTGSEILLSSRKLNPGMNICDQINHTEAEVP